MKRSFALLVALAVAVGVAPYAQSWAHPRRPRGLLPMMGFVVRRSSRWLRVEPVRPYGVHKTIAIS